MSEPKGQILPGSAFGDMLTKLATRSENIVEVGTWHGLGSTQCLRLGLIRPTQMIWTIERSLEMWKEASRYHADEPRIRLINAHTIDVVDKLPMRIDLLLLDGNDEQTDEEFEVLEPRCRVIALDDTNERKCKWSRAQLIEMKWTVLADRSDDRNGWAIFERP